MNTQNNFRFFFKFIVYENNIIISFLMGEKNSNLKVEDGKVIKLCKFKYPYKVKFPNI